MDASDLHHIILSWTLYTFWDWTLQHLDIWVYKGKVIPTLLFIVGATIIEKWKCVDGGVLVWTQHTRKTYSSPKEAVQEEKPRKIKHHKYAMKIPQRNWATLWGWVASFRCLHSDLSWKCRRPLCTWVQLVVVVWHFARHYAPFRAPISQIRARIMHAFRSPAFKFCHIWCAASMGWEPHANARHSTFMQKTCFCPQIRGSCPQ